MDTRAGDNFFFILCRRRMSFVTLLSFFITQSRYYTRDRNVTFIWSMLRNWRSASIIGCGGGSEVDSMLISGTGLALSVFLLEIFVPASLRGCDQVTGCELTGRELLRQLSWPSSLSSSRHRCCTHEIAAAGLADRSVWRCNTAGLAVRSHYG